MSDGEEENYGFYGKPLEQYDEDAHPKKRPITVEEQIATDAQGRRRFHGAFTGGFSAGFYNTVGSLEGWKPSEFKSSRSEKAVNNKRQRPEDYMDDEDVGEFGIAPQSVRATDDYNTSKKKKRKVFADGPIPGDPVLHSLIECGNETIGYLLLRNMGYKHKQADNQQQIDEDEDKEESSSKKIYGCEMPRSYEVKKTLENITYKIPEIYLKSLTNPKTNTFGLGYSGLDKSHVNLFVSSNLVVKERNNKKLSIAGQAFGVGAFEDDDEDIYVKEDLSKYDFELTVEKKKTPIKSHNNLLYDIFISSKKSFRMLEPFAPPIIPHSFTGKHKVKRSRFEPVNEPEVAPKRNEIDATIRAKYLGEDTSHKHTPSNQQHRVNEPTDNSTSVAERKPDVLLKTENILLNMGTSGLIFDRFVSASKSEDHVDLMEPVQSSETEHGTKDMRDAAKMKMYGPLTRVTIDWVPNSLVCKRFNIPEPNSCGDELKPRIRKPINLIFENEKYVSQPSIVNKPGLQNNEPIQSSLEIIEVDILGINEVASSLSQLNEILTKETEVINKLAQPVPIIKTLDETEKIDISKNADLFKAIFLDSDDDNEDENKEEEDTKIVNEAIEEKARDDELKEQLLSQDILLPKIKPMKEGILSNVSFVKFTKPYQKKESDIIQEKESPAIIDSYGPKLPEKIVQKHIFKVKDTIVDDEWVEKAETTKRKEHKHKKKNKKEKHKKKHKR